MVATAAAITTPARARPLLGLRRREDRGVFDRRSVGAVADVILPRLDDHALRPAEKTALLDHHVVRKSGTLDAKRMRRVIERLLDVLSFESTETHSIHLYLPVSTGCAFHHLFVAICWMIERTF
jgi:hypothetical protein